MGTFDFRVPAELPADLPTNEAEARLFVAEHRGTLGGLPQLAQGLYAHARKREGAPFAGLDFKAVVLQREMANREAWEQALKLADHIRLCWHVLKTDGPGLAAVARDLEPPALATTGNSLDSTFNAPQWLGALAARGVRIEMQDDGAIAAFPSSMLNETDRANLRRHREDIAMLLHQVEHF